MGIDQHILFWSLPHSQDISWTYVYGVTGSRLEVPATPSLGLIDLLDNVLFQNSETHLPAYYSIETDKQTKRYTQGEVWESLKCRSFSTHEAGCSISGCPTTWRLFEPHTLLVLMESSEAWSISNSIFSPSLFSREWGQDWNFQASNYGLVFLGTRFHPEPHPEVLH